MLELNLTELARFLSCSVPTLSAMLKRWPDFPVIKEGGRGRNWRFDPRTVVAYLQAKRDEESATKAERNEALAQLVLPIVRLDETGAELSLDDRLKAVKLRRLEQDEAKVARFLVRKDEVKTALEEACRLWAEIESNTIDEVTREHNLPEAFKRSLSREFAHASAAFRRSIAEYLADEDGRGDQAGDPGLFDIMIAGAR